MLAPLMAALPIPARHPWSQAIRQLKSTVLCPGKASRQWCSQARDAEQRFQELGSCIERGLLPKSLRLGKANPDEQRLFVRCEQGTAVRNKVCEDTLAIASGCLS